MTIRPGDSRRVAGATPAVSGRTRCVVRHTLPQ